MAKGKATKKKAQSAGRVTIGQARRARDGVFDHARKTGVRHTKVYAMAQTPAIHVGDERFEVKADRSILVPADMVGDFLKMGCTREPPEE